MKSIHAILLFIFLSVGRGQDIMAQKSGSQLNALQDSIKKYRQADPAKSLSFLSAALSIAVKNGDRKTEAVLYNNAGSIYEQLGDIEKGLDYFLKALKITESLHADKETARYQVSIGGLYTEIGQYALAKQYLEKALSTSVRINDSIGMAKAHNNLGNAYQKEGKPETALEHYTKTLSICESKNILKGISIASNNIANIYKDLKKFEAALQAYQRALDIAIAEKDETGSAFFMNNIGGLYNDRGNYTKALTYILKSLPVAEKANEKSLLINVYAQLSTAYFGNAQYKEAYVTLDKYNKLTEKIFTENSSKKVAEMQALYETEKKELQILTLTKENEKQAAISDAVNLKKNIIIGCVAAGMFITLLFSLFILRAFRKTRRQKQIIEKQNAEAVLARQIIEEKQKEVLDSIYYARRIQQSLLPSERYINKILSKK